MHVIRAGVAFSRTEPARAKDQRLDTRTGALLRPETRAASGSVDGGWAAQACRPYGASAAQRAQAWTADGRAIIDHRNGRADTPPAHWLTGSQALAGRATGARIIATYARYGGAKEMLVTEVLGTAVLGTADAHPLSAAAVSSARARPCYIAGEIGTGGAARRERRGPGAGASNGSRPRRACGWGWRRRGLPLRQP